MKEIIEDVNNESTIKAVSMNSTFETTHECDENESLSVKCELVVQKAKTDPQ